jgi:hypothetical protein
MMMKQLHLALYLCIALVVLTAGAFGYYYFQTTGTLSDRNATIAALQQQNGVQKTEAEALNIQLTAAQDNITAANTQIASLNAQVSSLNNQVSSAQSSLTSASSQVTTLSDQLTEANSRITDLTNQVTSLQSVTALSRTMTVASAFTLSQSPAQETTAGYFNPTYPGYILVTGYSSSTSGYIRVTDSFTGYPYTSTQLSFGTGNYLYIPVLPGTVIVYFGNTETTSTVTASINITYYY